MTWCPHEKSTSRLCDPCREWRNTVARMYQRALRAERLADGYCVRCGKLPFVHGRAMCAGCTTRAPNPGGRRGMPESPRAEEIVAAFRSGEEPLAIAARLQVAKETVYHTLDRRGLRARVRRATPTEGRASV